jgi:hypothetical protein
MPLAAALLAVLALAAAARSSRWPLMHDAALLHYVVFLMDHGHAPYRDIVEMNMPGAYMAEWAGIHLLGGGDRGWWIYDSLLALLGTAASAWIAGPRCRSAGVAAGALAYLDHRSVGPSDTGQRDYLIAVLLLAAFGCLFHAVRSRRPAPSHAWIAAFTALCGLAASVKPPVIAFAVLFVAVVYWRNRRAPSRYRMLLWSLLGALVPAAAVAIFLARWGVTRDFFATARGLVPWYAALARLPLLDLFCNAAYDNRRLALLATSALACLLLDRAAQTATSREAPSHNSEPLNREPRNWESHMLALAALCGLALFLAQGKGWSYHLATETAFLALWAMLQLDRALQTRPPQPPLPPDTPPRLRRLRRAAATTALIALIATWATVALAAQGLFAHRHDDPSLNDAVPALQADLTALAGPPGTQSLSGRVQCLDMTAAGCINVLYRLNLVQSTGFIYDFYLFPQHGNPVTRHLQQRFLQQLTAHPPEAIVLSAHTWPDGCFGYEQLARWPDFAAWLAARYHLAHQFPQPRRGPGYRLYLLNLANS